MLLVSNSQYVYLELPDGMRNWNYNQNIFESGSELKMTTKLLLKVWTKDSSFGIT